MRIKTLLCLAALTAGLATSMAQSNVYSLNIVGYVTTTNNSGFSIIANPLNGTNNNVSSIFADAPVGTKVFRFNGGGGYDIATYDPDDGWLNTFNVDPGLGVWIQLPSQYIKTYVGEVQLGSTNNVPSGFSIKSSVIPQAGKLQTELLWPAHPGDKVFKFNGSGYDIYTFDPDDGWIGPLGVGDEPKANVAQGFWIQNNFGSTEPWVRNFTVGP